MDTRLFLDVERLARHTGWAYGFMRALVLYGAAAAMLLLVVVCGWWVRRSGDTGAMALALWIILGAVLAAGLSAAAAHAIGRNHPYQSLHGVVVLVPRVGTFSFPSTGAAAAGAAGAGVALFGRAPFTALAALLSLLWAFALVYVGFAYPIDVLAGLILGGTVVVVLRPGGTFVLGALLRLKSPRPAPGS
jgi:membrane-associated phospholipid phosphatase